MIIIHKNNQVLAAVYGDDISPTLKALGVSEKDVSTIEAGSSTESQLQTHEWHLENGRVVVGSLLSTEQPKELPSDSDRLKALEAAVDQLILDQLMGGFPG